MIRQTDKISYNKVYKQVSEQKNNLKIPEPLYTFMINTYISLLL